MIGSSLIMFSCRGRRGQRHCVRQWFRYGQGRLRWRRRAAISLPVDRWPPPSPGCHGEYWSCESESAWHAGLGGRRPGRVCAGWATVVSVRVRGRACPGTRAAPGGHARPACTGAAGGAAEIDTMTVPFAKMAMFVALPNNAMVTNLPLVQTSDHNRSAWARRTPTSATRPSPSAAS